MNLGNLGGLANIFRPDEFIKRTNPFNTLKNPQDPLGLNAVLYPDKKSPSSGAAGAGFDQNRMRQEFQAGRQFGQEVLGGPEYEQMRSRLEDLSKGFSGQELGALRGEAMSNIRGQRAPMLRQISNQLAKSGIGGARRAAMLGASDRGISRDVAGAERKLAVDQAGMIREGNKALQDFINQRRFGELASGLTAAQLGASERGAAASLAAANKEPKKGLLGNIFGDLF